MPHPSHSSAHARDITNRRVMPALMALTGVALFLFAHPAAGIAVMGYAGLAAWIENKRPAARASAPAMAKAGSTCHHTQRPRG